MKQVLDKQKMQSPDTMGGNASTSKLEMLTKENNVLYVDFAKKQLAQLEQLNKTMVDSLGDKGELSKTLDAIQVNVAPAKGMGQTKSGPPGLVGAGKDWIKDLFTVRGFLDKTSILKRGHNETGVGRVADKYLENRENSFKPQPEEVKPEEVKPNDAQPPKNETADLMQDQIQLLEIIAENAPLVVEKLQKSLEEQSVIRKVSEGRVKFNADTGRYHEQGKEARNKMIKEADVRTTSTKGSLDPSDEGRVRTFTRVKKTETVADPDKPKVVKAADVEDSNSTKKRAKVVKPAANDESFSGGTSSGLGAADMTEADMENQKLMQEQTELLKAIAENTGGARKPNDAQKPKAESGGGGFLDGIMGMLGSGIMNAAKFLFNPKNLLKAFTKFLLPAMIIGSLINGIMDGFKAFMETGSIAEALIAGFGGILSFLTFGLIDAETIRSIVNFFTGFIDDYIIQPLKDFFGFLGKAFDKYIAKPIMDAMSAVGDMLNEYIVQPIKTFFAPIADFFKKIKDQVFGFLEDFGIPEVGFTIPIIGKKVSIGPFYPFRPGEGTDKVSTNSEVKSSSSSAGESTNLKENIGITNKNETTVFNSESKESSNGPGTYSRTMAKFDPKTGKASYTNEDDPNNLKYNAPLTKGGFNEIKKASKEGAGSDKIKEIIKEDEAYQKLGFFDKMKVDVGYAKATDLAKLKPADEPQTGNKVAAQSADSEMAKNAPASSSSTVIAPMSSVNNNSSSTYAIKPPVRNPNAGVQNQMQKRYGT